MKNENVSLTIQAKCKMSNSFLETSSIDTTLRKDKKILYSSMKQPGLSSTRILIERTFFRFFNELSHAPFLKLEGAR